MDQSIFFVNESSPASVQKVYLDQFQKDFMNFLKSRSVEMVSGGHMVISFLAKSDNSPMQLVQDSLKQMVDEGIIQESKLDHFIVPLYPPSEEEVRNRIEMENSFKIKRIEEFEVSWDANIEDGNNELLFDISERAKYVASYSRAIIEPMLASYFGDAIIDDLFGRLSFRVNNCLEKRIGLTKYVVVSLIKKN
ncbi:probable caffeine synthase MTL2 [Euphorbia lathyris]|uniref:probable caffeine synthase MTL2 n=1 Tax=Euphorbia lathyris TaxID=212925 RepID=UPI003313EDC2